MPLGMKVAAQAAGFALALVALIFIPAGTLNYWQAWLMLAVYAVSAVVMVVYLRATNPAALERRERSPLEEQSPSQQRIVLAAIVCYFAVYVVAGLDHRFGWSSVTPTVLFVGNALIVASFIVFALVLRTNTFAATNIAVESGQQVATTGPYAIVRHPMYCGVILLVAGIALALGSYWAVLLVLPTAAFFTFRLLDEERFLDKNLPGYAGYREQTRWRLIPGIF
jgi:protein-S-isoprenylcysteine O-methyltransferase Ste14